MRNGRRYNEKKYLVLMASLLISSRAVFLASAQEADAPGSDFPVTASPAASRPESFLDSQPLDSETVEDVDCQPEASAPALDVQRTSAASLSETSETEDVPLFTDSADAPGTSAEYTVVVPDHWDEEFASLKVSWSSFSDGDTLSIFVESENDFQMKDSQSGIGVPYQLFIVGQDGKEHLVNDEQSEGQLMDDGQGSRYPLTAFSGEGAGDETVRLHIIRDAAHYVGVYTDALTFTAEFHSI